MAGAHAKPAGLRRRGARARPAGVRADDGLADAAHGAGQRRLADVARGGTLNLAGALVAAASTLAITVLVTRHFSKPVAGAFFAAISLFLIIEAAASLGAYVGLVNFIAGLRSLARERDIPAILRAAVLPVLVVALICAAAMLLAAGPLARFLLSGQLGHTASLTVATAALRALAVALPFAAMLDTLLGAGRGYRDMRATVVVDKIGRSAFQLIALLIATAAGWVSLLAPLWALPYIPAAAAAWILLRRIMRARPQPGQDRQPAARRRRVPLAARYLEKADARSFWRFTAPRALAALAQITIQRLDIVLVAIMRGPAAAAVYTAATRFLVAGQFANTSISMAAQPRLAELFTAGDRRAAQQVYQTTTAWLVLLTWPLYLLAVAYGPAVLSIFGRSYLAGNTVMMILACTMLLATACGQVDLVLISIGRSGWSLANGLAAVGLNVGIDLLLIPRYGITGAAIGWAVAIVVTNLTPLAQIAAVYGLHPLGGGTVAAAAVSAVSFGIVPLGVRAVLGTSLLPTVAALAAGGLLFAGGLWRFRSALQLSVMPGLSAVSARLRSRAASRAELADRL